MLTYQVELAPAAQRQLKKFSHNVRKAIFKQLELLKLHPRPEGTKKLSGMDNLYRVRAGDYRVIYAINDDVLVVLVLKVGNRKEVYRNLTALS